MDSRILAFVANKGCKENRREKKGNGADLYVGIDVGSTSSDIVVLTEAGEVLHADYRRTSGKVVDTLLDQIEELKAAFNSNHLYLAGLTGTASKYLAGSLDVAFVNEVCAQAEAIGHLYPALNKATVIDMGGMDSKLIFLKKDNENVRILDFALNTMCAAGTGSFLDQQAKRLGVQIENEFGQMACACKNVPHMAGRCSVFAKSDMIHLQQLATPTEDIVAGLCWALARNLKSNLAQGKDFALPIIFTGGVAANQGVIKAIQGVFGLKQNELIVPEKFFFTGAVGAAIAGRKKTKSDKFQPVKISKLAEELIKKSKSPQKQVILSPLEDPGKAPQSKVYTELLSENKAPLKAYLGVDVGSISTNVVVIDQKFRVLEKAYLMTAGRPLEAVKQGLDIVADKIKDKVEILASATTGSGRYLTGDFIGADTVINEITAQAAGTAVVYPKVDTIFEIGGQDSKYISLNNGVVVDFEMNHACAAGTGSFLEEQAQRLNINIKNEFAQLALNSKAPLKLGERCTVFMESDLISCQQKGACSEDMLAGLSYSIVSNYLNRVVGRRRIGDNICFQGGTAFNKAVWAAFESVTGKTVNVPDHHEVTGAIGAAVVAAKRYQQKNDNQDFKTTFKGFGNIVNASYSVKSFVCQHCPNNCEIKCVKIQNSEPLFYGSRCDRYNIKNKANAKSSPSAFEFRYRKMMQHSQLNNHDSQKRSRNVIIGIPLALVNWQLMPFFASFFKSLGFKVVISNKTDSHTIARGIDHLVNQPCFPVKVAHGHAADLIDKNVDYLFVPSIVAMSAAFETNKNNKLCPYVTSLPYQLSAAFAQHMKNTKFISPVLRLDEDNRSLAKQLASIEPLKDISRCRITNAVKAAGNAQSDFENELRDYGTKTIESLEDGERLFVLVSRPYNGCDPGVNLDIPKKLAAMGIKMIPLDMLDLNAAPVTDPHLHASLYWAYGQKIIRAAEIIKNDDRLFAVYLSNFSCGPDSFLLTFFKELMGQKPCLQLELDEHSADAGVVTRLEAFVESLKNYQPPIKKQPPQPFCHCGTNLSDKTLYIPFMSECSYGVAAAFRAYGQNAEVMKLGDQASLLKGRHFLTGKECLPCAITAGEILTTAKRQDFIPEKSAFFMPSASGPCRFGMYNCMHKLILKHAKIHDAAVIAPNQDSSFYVELLNDGQNAVDFLKHAWVATVGIDLMNKVRLKVRGCAVDKNVAEQIYQKALQKWLDEIQNNADIQKCVSLMADFANQMSQTDSLAKNDIPRVGIVGEIYVRSHPFANDNLIKKLEAMGVACELASLSEWIYYTNLLRFWSSARKKHFSNLQRNWIQNFFQKRIERILAKPLEEKFGKLVEEDIKHVLKLASPYIHHSFEGEAVLSVGKIVELYQQGVAGVVNVMPFTCMPSTIVSGQTTRLSANCDDLPILNINFDGQKDASLETRLNAFVEQVRQRKSKPVKFVDSSPATAE
jgi:predicted CoA-substrate-specific enzyme activase